MARILRGSWTRGPDGAWMVSVAGSGRRLRPGRVVDVLVERADGSAAKMNVRIEAQHRGWALGRPSR